MTSLVWANFPLAAIFIAAFAGVPLWMTFRRPEKAPDLSEARAYLRAKAELGADRAVAPVTIPADLRDFPGADRVTGHARWRRTPEAAVAEHSRRTARRARVRA